MKILLENKKDTSESQTDYHKTMLQKILVDEDRKYDFTVLDFMKLKKTELNSLVFIL